MKRQQLAQRDRQQGVALLLVLWACTLLAILLGGYAALARTEGLQARYQFAQTQAHYAAEAGIMRAFYGLQDQHYGIQRKWQGRSQYRHAGGAAGPVPGRRHGSGASTDLGRQSRGVAHS